MNNDFKKNLGFPWGVTLVFGLLLVISFVFDPPFYLADHKPLLTTFRKSCDKNSDNFIKKMKLLKKSINFSKKYKKKV